MASKKIKWIAFISTMFLTGGLVIAAPLVASKVFWTNQRSGPIDYDVVYPLPETGKDVSSSIATWGVNEDRISNRAEANLRFQKAIENTWVFAGGSDFYSNFDLTKSRKNWVGLFDENIRWYYKVLNTSNPASLYSTMGRFVINVSKPNQTLKELNEKFNSKVSNLDPKNVVTIVGNEYLEASDEYNSLVSFENDLTTFVKNSLMLRDQSSTVTIIKHWKSPIKDFDTDTAYNNKVDKFNNVVNKVLYNMSVDETWSESLSRVKVIDWTDLFINHIDSQTEWPFDDNHNIIARWANSLLGKELVMAFDEGNAWTQGTIEDPESAWHGYETEFIEATTLDGAVDTTKNNLQLGTVTQTTTQSTTSYSDQPVVNLSVEIPNAVEGQYLKYILEIPDAGLTIEDYSFVTNKVITIDNIGTFPTTSTSPITNQAYTNKFELTVFDINNQPYDRLTGVLGNTSADSTTLLDSTPTDLTDAQKRFIEKFNNKNEPMVWAWVGDNVDQGVQYNVGFDSFSEVTQKSIQSDWGRWDDIFINAAMSGDFTNRAADDYLIQSRITKYAPDVLSIGLGVNDLTTGTSNGQTTNTNKDTFESNIKKIVDAAIEANPEVIIVVNAINPNGTTTTANNISTYNGYLKALFGDSTTSGGSGSANYKNNVIYNESVYTILNQVKTQHPWLYANNNKYNWFMGSDGINPSISTNIIKSKTFLSSLGVNVENSYLDSYQVKAGTPFSSSTTKSIDFAAGNTSNGPNWGLPDLKAWLATLPIGGSAANGGNVGRVMINIESTDVSDDRVYLLEPSYNSLTTTSSSTSNNYVIPFLDSGDYVLSSWAISRTAVFSSNADYYLAPANSSFKIN
ncbi:SGNH/GDSL hydrolase family protein [Malacoplasma penetrans]|uniref:Predicted lipase n=1 Tax=Malacoplasma penetrans (strain HF-2) TaxID=272633 RepID=Q8EVG5_MALP2|nr:SGNH/GDSL hydrolase family protein [Malacoplasma penetrans]RXY96930.1 SGNH/GDSL hydrolase family protein [Malacoplasma penetrans]BAC44389.1 predicted lipase [Malacoplasma penetrans HF-2]